MENYLISLISWKKINHLLLMHEIFNTNFSSPGKHMLEFWRAVAACSRTGHAQEERPPAQPAPCPSLCRLLLRGPRRESRPWPAKARILNFAVLQRANGIRVHLILLTKTTFHQIITLLILIAYFNMKSPTKHHLLLWFPLLGGLSHQLDGAPRGRRHRHGGSLRLHVSHPSPPPCAGTRCR